MMGVGTVNETIERRPDFSLSLFGSKGESNRNTPRMRVTMDRPLSLRQELDLRELLDNWLVKEGLA